MNAKFCRLSVIFATDAKKAVIFRRGPSLWTQVILWHTDTDTFENGQWFRGRIYAERCDLSPDGTKMIYLAAKHHRWRTIDPEYSSAWTAISKPPYLTALALWRNIGTYGGGGYFEDDVTVWLNWHFRGEPTPHKNHVPAPDLNVKWPKGHFWGEEGLSAMYLERHGWTQIQERGPYKYAVEHTYDPPGIWQKQVGDYVLTMRQVGSNWKRHGSHEIVEYRLHYIPTGAKVRLDTDIWADWDQQNRLVYVKDGCLWMAILRGNAVEPKLIGDFNANKPKLIVAPEWAKTWN